MDTKLDTCPVVLTSGKRKGEPCGGKPIDGEACRRHSTGNLPDKIRQQKKALVIEAYAKCGVVGKACEIGGISRATFYDWLDKDPDFARSAMEAVEEAADMLEIEATRRAVDGVESTVFNRNGEEVGTDVKYSDTLLIFLLKARRPARFRERFDATLHVDTGLPVSEEAPQDDRLSHLLDSMHAFQAQPAIEATSREHPE